MSQTFFIPAYSAATARTKFQLFKGEPPFYWRDSKAAHDVAEQHYPAGLVFAVTEHADGAVTVREHIQIDHDAACEIMIDQQPLTVQDALFLASYVAVVVSGVWLVGKATLL